MNYNIIKKTNDWLFCPWGPKRDMRNLAMIPLISVWYWYILKPSVSHQNPLFLEWKTSLLAEFFPPIFTILTGPSLRWTSLWDCCVLLKHVLNFIASLFFFLDNIMQRVPRAMYYRLVILRFSLKTSVTCYAKMGYYKYLNGFFSSNK